MNRRQAGATLLMLGALAGYLTTRAFPPPPGLVGVIFDLLLEGLALEGVWLAGSPRAKMWMEKRHEKARKEALDHLKDMGSASKGDALPAIAPPPVVPGATQTQGEVASLEEFPVDAKLGWELTRIAVGNPPKRITIYKGTVAVKSSGTLNRPPKILFIHTEIDRRHMLYYIDPKHIIKVVSEKATVSYKIVFDILHSEALAQDGSLNWDDDLEMILADSSLDQYVTIAEAAPGFQLSGTLKRVMLVIALLGVLMGISLNGSLHIVPTTIIHWVP